MLSEQQQQLIREDTANKKLWDEALDSLKEGPVGTFSCLTRRADVCEHAGAPPPAGLRSDLSRFKSESIPAAASVADWRIYKSDLIMRSWSSGCFHSCTTFSLSLCICIKEFPAQDGTDLHVRLLPGAGLPAHHHNLLAQRLQGAWRRPTAPQRGGTGWALTSSLCLSP